MTQLFPHVEKCLATNAALHPSRLTMVAQVRSVPLPDPFRPRMPPPPPPLATQAAATPAASAAAALVVTAPPLHRPLYHPGRGRPASVPGVTPPLAAVGHLLVPSALT